MTILVPTLGAAGRSEPRPAAGDDAELVQRAQGGDREAFVALYRRHVDAVYGYALRQLGDVQDAEDVTSETFLKVVAGLSSFDQRASFRTWLFTIVRNQLRDRWRAERRRPRTVAFDEVLDAVPGGATAEGDAHRRTAVGGRDDARSGDVDGGPDGAPARAAAGRREGDPSDDDTPASALGADGQAVIAALPERYRRVLLLRVGHGRSVKDVAEAMGTTPGNVKVLQHRALKRAAALAESLAPDPPPDAEASR